MLWAVSRFAGSPQYFYSVSWGWRPSLYAAVRSAHSTPSTVAPIWMKISDAQPPVSSPPSGRKHKAWGAPAPG